MLKKTDGELTCINYANEDMNVRTESRTSQLESQRTSSIVIGIRNST